DTHGHRADGADPPGRGHRAGLEAGRQSGRLETARGGALTTTGKEIAAPDRGAGPSPGLSIADSLAAADNEPSGTPLAPSSRQKGGPFMLTPFRFTLGCTLVTAALLVASAADAGDPQAEPTA